MPNSYELCSAPSGCPVAKPADHLAGVVLAPRVRPAPTVPPRTLGYADADFARRGLVDQPPRLRCCCGSLPPEGAGLDLGRPSAAAVEVARRRRARCWCNVPRPGRQRRSSHYAAGLCRLRPHSMAWAYAVPHFRGCSGELNHAPRAYHSGDFAEIGWILQSDSGRGTTTEAVAHHCWWSACLWEAMHLLRWAARNAGDSALLRWCAAVAAVCSPHRSCSRRAFAIGRGFNRLGLHPHVSQHHACPKALRKLEQHPGLFDGATRLKAARDLYEFDNIFTAPLHGFKSTQRITGRRASAKPHSGRAFGCPP